MIEKIILVDEEKLLNIKTDIQRFADQEGLFFNLKYEQTDQADKMTGYTEHIMVMYGFKDGSTDSKDLHSKMFPFCDEMKNKYGMWFYFIFKKITGEKVVDEIAISYRSSVNISK